MLRQPLEDRIVQISRAAGTLTFPARFMLVAAMNPCKCGWHGDPTRACGCAPAQISQYQKRLSGPLLDRIDMHISVLRVPYDKLSDLQPGESSAVVRARVQTARDRQQLRFMGTALTANADMNVAELRVFAPLDDAGRGLMKAAMNQMRLSARGYHRVIKLARTIADLAGVPEILSAHLAEALQYRARVAE